MDIKVRLSEERYFIPIFGSSEFDTVLVLLVGVASLVIVELLVLNAPTIRSNIVEKLNLKVLLPVALIVFIAVISGGMPL